MFPRLDMKKYVASYNSMLYLYQLYTEQLMKDMGNEKLRLAQKSVFDSLEIMKDMLSEVAFVMGRKELLAEKTMKLAEHTRLLAYRLQQVEEEKESLRFTISELQKEIDRLAELAEEPDAKQIAEKQFKENTK